MKEDGGVGGVFEGALPVGDGLFFIADLHGDGAEIVEDVGLRGVDAEADAPPPPPPTNPVPNPRPVHGEWPRRFVYEDQS